MFDKLKWRTILIGYFIAIPFYYVWVALSDLWAEDTIFEVYGYWLESFKKGAKI